MGYPTLNDIVQDVVTIISLVSGTAVQTYAEDRIALEVQLLHDLLIDKHWWDDYMEYIDSDLDGTFGSPTADISSINRFTDIKNIYIKFPTSPSNSVGSPFGGSRPLMKIPNTNFNPALLTGTTPTHYKSDRTVTGKVVRIFPATAVDAVTLHARIRPARFTPTSEVRMDRLMLTYGAAWYIAEDDGTNPGQIAKFEAIFNERYSDLISLESDDPIPLDSGDVNDVPMQWQC